MPPHIITGFQQDAHLRASLSALARQTFGIDFEAWYQQGFWSERCLPYAWVQDGEVIASLLAHRMDICWAGKWKHALQLGTIATRPDFRAQGLAGKLLNEALEHHARAVDFVFLFANASVTGFYPKFGFVPVRETRFWVDLPPGLPRAGSLGNPADLTRVTDLSTRRAPVSSVLGVNRDLHLLLFYALTALQGCFYDLGACLVVCKQAGSTLHLYDVIASRAPDLDTLLPRLCLPGLERIEFHFTPRLTLLPVQVDVLDDPDSVLFMRPPMPMRQPFRFPVTAQA